MPQICVTYDDRYENKIKFQLVELSNERRNFWQFCMKQHYNILRISPFTPKVRKNLLETLTWILSLFAPRWAFSPTRNKHTK